MLSINLVGMSGKKSFLTLGRKSYMAPCTPAYHERQAATFSGGQKGTHHNPRKTIPFNRRSLTVAPVSSFGRGNRVLSVEQPDRNAGLIPNSLSSVLSVMQGPKYQTLF